MIPSVIVVLGACLVSLVMLGVTIWQWRKRRARVSRMQRRMVAYEGKLRENGYNPDRVYHNFESDMLGNERYQSEEFEADVRYEDE